MRDNFKIFYENLPEVYKDQIELEAKYAAINNYERLVTSLMIASLAAVSLGSLMLPYSLGIKLGALIVFSATVPPMMPYLIISLAAERRKKEMEVILPDALLLVSANLKSGLSVEKAFLLSARDEFGPLAEEFRQTAMEMFGGKPVGESLMAMEDRVKSELLKETLKLLIDGLHSGGNTAKLLESSAADIRNSLELREEINANIRMYVIFIMMAAVVGAPLLFSISVYMSQTTSTMWQDVNVGEMSNSGNQLGLTFQKPNVNTAFFEEFSVMAIITINFFASLIISEIKNSNVKEGTKYIPVLVTISVVLFFITKTLIGSLMGGFT